MKLIAEQLGGARATASGTCFRGTAFGITVTSTDPVPGIATRVSARLSGDTNVELRARRDLMATWRGSSGRVYDEIRDRSGRVVFRLKIDPDIGYLFTLRRYGAYLVSADGTEILCAPPPVRPWFWERFVVARALPFATVLHGHEAFHASCVSLGGRGLALVGNRGDGKTSVAVQLALQGASILTDDVLALDRAEHAVVAHPGAALISVRRDQFRLLSATERTRLGTIVGRGNKVYVAPRSMPGRLPLSAIYFLSRGASGRSIRIRHLPRPDPRALLAASFVPFVQTPERLTRQLDVCAAISNDVPVFDIKIPSSVTAGEVAGRLATHSSALAPPASL